MPSGAPEDDDGAVIRYASPVCYAAEIAPDWFDPLGTDPEQARDVARWRRAERSRLLEDRRRLSAGARQAAAEAIAGHLDALLARLCSGLAGRVVAGYWPIKGEPDLRGWMARLHAAGARLALPVVEPVHAPLVFRPWSPGAEMVRGHWNILVPAVQAATVPGVILAPLVGWDGEGYRLGYGGGYFDRTLAALKTPRLAIGVGFDAARLSTIFPQPHDIRLDAIVTESGVQVLTAGPPEGEFPAALAPYRRTAVFTEGTIPAGLLRSHRTRPGTWARLHVLEGALRFSDPPGGPGRILGPGVHPVIFPERPHEVAPCGPVRFFVEFCALPETGAAPD